MIGSHICTAWYRQGVDEVGYISREYSKDLSFR